jgi:AcrR family transcriptional regulator
MKTEAAKRRPYRQQARAAAAAENTRRILAAAEELFSQRLYDHVTLDDVARRAGVGVQTLIRRFPTKEALLGGVNDVVQPRIEAQRSQAPAGDVAGIVRNLADHYEETGDPVLLLLSQEERVPAFAEVTAAGRRMHRAWVRQVFARWLRGLPPAARERRTVQLVAICDVYVWKVMRRDQGFTRDQYERALKEMIDRLLEEGA